MSVYTDYEGAIGNAIVSSTGIMSVLAGALVYFIIISIIGIIMIISWYKIFKQNGKKGWLSLIPFCNMWVFLTIVGLPGWIIFLPVANGLAFLYAYYKLAVQYGKSTLFAVASIFFPYVCLPILAFTYKKENMESTGDTSYNEYQNNINNNNFQNHNEVSQQQNIEMNQNITGFSNTNSVPNQFCQNCGTKRNMDELFCSNCGQKY